MGYVMGFDGLVADVDEFVVNSLRVTGKKHPLKSPIGKEYDLFIFRSLAGKHIAEKVFGHQIRLHPTKLTGKQAVGLVQNGRCPALGALMFNKKIDGCTPCR